MNAPNPPAEQEFVARLEAVHTDISGVAQVEISDLPGQVSLPRFRKLAAAKGWEVDRLERSGKRLFVQVKRAGSSTTTSQAGPQFITGPSLAELRGNEVACEEAAAVLRETGVDVLSDATLDEARRTHLNFRRKVMRFGWLCALPAVFGFSGLFFSPVLWREGNTTAGNVLVIASVVALVVFAALLVLPIRFERARKAAVADYTSGYERVVAAALAAQKPHSDKS